MTQSVLNEQEYTSRLDLNLWRRVLRYMLPYRRLLLPFAGLAVLLAGCEASYNLMTRSVIDAVLAKGAAAPLARYALIYLGLTLTVGCSLFSFIMLGGRISTNMSRDIRRAGFARLQTLEFAYFDTHPTGWLMARMTSDCDRLANIITWGILDLTWGLTLMSGIAVIMACLSWKLALVTLGVTPVMAVICLYFQRILLNSSRVVRKTNSLITSTYNEGIMGAETTKTLVRERANLGEFQDLSGRMRSATIRNALQAVVFFPLIFTLGSLGGGLALWLGGNQVLSGAISLGTLLAFITYAYFFFAPIFEVSRVFTELQIAQASAERIIGLIDTEPQIKDSPSVAEAIARHQAANGKSANSDYQSAIRNLQSAIPQIPNPKSEIPNLAIDGLPARIGEIEFRDVSFEYKPGRPVLQDFNLTVRAGERIALVGPTGGGKSTIVALLCRFYEPTQGQILFDGVDYRERSLDWLQSSLGIVLQTPHLFSGTIGDNIKYGRLTASQAEIEEAAQLVGAHEFINEMTDGYASKVGQGGVNLSTGQKQLISFARAILANPQIFVMDEATSSVDTPTEQLIQRGLATVMRERTSFIIAHRLSTIRHADRILVIEKGRRTEIGSHHDLLRQRGHYYELYTNQFTEEREEEILHEE